MEKTYGQKPSLNAVSGFLVGLLGLRALDYLATSGDIMTVIIASAYIIGVVGVLMKNQFGPIIAIVVACFDLIYSFIGEFLASAMLYDLAIIALAFMEFQRMSFADFSSPNKAANKTDAVPIIICVACGAKNSDPKKRKCRICGKRIR